MARRESDAIMRLVRIGSISPSLMFRVLIYLEFFRPGTCDAFLAELCAVRGISSDYIRMAVRAALLVG